MAARLCPTGSQPSPVARPVAPLADPVEVRHALTVSTAASVRSTRLAGDWRRRVVWESEGGGMDTADSVTREAEV